MDPEDKLYGEVLDMMLLLRDVAYEFKCYSANDIKKLITSKLKAVREVRVLKQLYRLEEVIGGLRSSFVSARAANLVSLAVGTNVPVEQAPALGSHLVEQPFPHKPAQ
jgi:hypothetical protein